MIVYRDRTYCSATSCSKFEGCNRAYTHKVQKDAEAFGLPVSLVEKLDCYEERDGKLC